MAPSHKRKHAATEDQQTKMESFAVVSKTAVDMTKKRRKVIEKVVEKENVPVTVAAVARPARKTEDANTAKVEKKRKRRSIDLSSDDETPTASIFKQFAKKPASASKRQKAVVLPPSPADTPSKKAAALFSTLHLSAADKAIPFALSAKKQQDSVVTPPPSDDDTVTTVLPSALQALVDLHTAFLSALALHYAHNGGTTSPVNVAALLPQITKTWKVRAVTLDDLQRILSPLLHSGENGGQWTLEDFGPRAGVRLSQRSTDNGPVRGRAPKRAASGFIDQEGSNARFGEALQERWSKSEATDAAAFLANLPLAAIIPYTSNPSAPILARGAQRLADLKSAAITTQQHPQITPSSTTTTSAQPQTSTAAPPASRTSTLLDRILARQQQTATHNATNTPLTPEQQARHTALHRISDIHRVLVTLSGTKTTSSFSFATVTQHLQQSLRSPISREEVERCLALMAGEITVGCVKIVGLGGGDEGGVRGVVVSRGLVGLGTEVVRQRVQEALERR